MVDRVLVAFNFSFTTEHELLNSSHQLAVCNLSPELLDDFQQGLHGIQ